MFFTTCLTSLVWCKRVNLWSWGVKASAYTLPNMGPYPECKSGPWHMAEAQVAACGSLWSWDVNVRWFKMIQDDSRCFKMIKIFQTSFNIFQHVSKCYKSTEFLRSHLSSVPFFAVHLIHHRPHPRPQQRPKATGECDPFHSGAGWGDPLGREPRADDGGGATRHGEDGYRRAGRGRIWQGMGSGIWEKWGHVQIDTDWDSHHLETWSDFES